MNPEYGVQYVLILCTIGFLVVLLHLLHPLPVNGQPRDTAPLSLPSDPFTFQPGPGSSIASSYCGVCHSAEYIYMQPLHSEKTWSKIVKKMKSAFGCSIPDDQILPLVKYLVSQNETQPASFMEEVKTPPTVPPKGHGKVEHGKEIYERNCLACHGTGGKGDGPLGNVLVPPAGDLTATGNQSDQDLLQTIQNGRPGTAMPAWKGGLSSQDMQDVLAYIRSLSQ